MIKKISAILLALVLCLSVVVVPVSAYELASGSKIAYIVELDKEYYSAGETVTVKLFIYADEATEYNGGAIVFGCHSDVFDQSENIAADVKASATTGDNASTFYKQFSDLTWAWQTNTTIYNNIVTNNTDEENTKFDQFIKVAPARLSTADGTHENSQNSKKGYYGSDFNAESDAGIPYLTFQLKLRDDIADGTVINVGVPTGPMAKNYTYMDTFKSPGTATTKVKTNQSNSEVVWSTTSQVGEEPKATYTVTYVDYDGSVIATYADVETDPAAPANPTRTGYTFAGWSEAVDADGNKTYTATYTINKYTVAYKDGSTVLQSTEVEYGAATPTCAAPSKDGYVFVGWNETIADTVTADATYTAKWLPKLVVADMNKEQIKFEKNKADGTYAGEFAYRTFAEFTNFNTVFANVADATDSTDGDAILEAGFIFNKGGIDIDKAKAQVEGGAVTYPVETNVADQAYISTSFVKDSYVMACVVYNIPDAEVNSYLGALAYVKYMQNGETYYAYADVSTASFKGLYDTYYSQQFPSAEA